jgi:hypothetical protein
VKVNGKKTFGGLGRQKSTGKIGQILGVRVSTGMDYVSINAVFDTKAWNRATLL